MTPGAASAAFACAHRGLSSEKAENTLAAFGAAVTAGFPAVEMDLRTTADGEVVVLHDAALERTTDAAGRVDAVAWRDLQRASTRDGPVPRLGDLFASLAAWDGLWNLEIKARAALAPTLEIVRRAGLGRRALVSSMDAGILLEAHRLAPDVPRASIPLGPLDDSDLAAAREAQCSWINVDHDFLDGDELVRMREAGLRVGAWTVNDAARAAELAAAGVQCIITDRRDVGAAFRGRPASWV
jgi:glycerophosphoryl diester phosphodiesterase